MDEREILDKLCDKLAYYLFELHGVEVNASNFFKCINPKHNDKTPSACLMPQNPHLFHCFGCNITGNIFHAAHFLENLPIQGPEFWEITVPKIAQELNIPYDIKFVKGSDRSLYQAYRAYADVSEIISTPPEDKDGNPDKSSNFCKYLEHRGWSIETAQALKIGAVSSYEEISKKLLELGWDEAYLFKNGILNRKVLDSNNLIFNVRDSKGNSVGYAARNMAYEKYGGEKYKNSQSSDVYKKSEILYLFDDAKKHAPPIYIVEGYGDAVTMWQSGIKNVAAIGGTAFTSGHLELLEKHEIYDIILALDNDDAGLSKMEKIIYDYFTKSYPFKVKILIVPPNEQNANEPDTYIRAFGADAFRKIELKRPFDFLLSRLSYDEDRSEVAKKMVKFIAMDESPIERNNMMKSLAAYADIPFSVIMEEVNSELNKNDVEVKKDVYSVSHKLERKLRNTSPDSDPEGLITQALYEIKEIKKSKEQDNPTKHKGTIGMLEDMFWKRTGAPGLDCGRFKQINEALEGNMPNNSGCLIGLAAVSNIGKTSLLRNLAWELIQRNPTLRIVFMSIDDNLDKIVPTMVALDSGLKISSVISPKEKILMANYLSNDEKKDRIYKWKASFAKLKAMSNRLILREVTDGSSTNTVEKYMNMLRSGPDADAPAMLFLDNFHKLSDPVTASMREKYTECSATLKRFTSQFRIPIIMTLELRKGNFYFRPTLQDVKETIDIEYDCDLLWMMHQDMHVNQKTHLKFMSDGKVYPIVELMFSKNKISSFKDTVFMNFYTDKSLIEEIPPDVGMKLLIATESEKKSRREGGGFQPF